MRELECVAVDWTDLTLGDVCTFKGGNGFPRAIRESKRVTSHSSVAISIAREREVRYIVAKLGIGS
jgi:hypothetical protein